MLTLFLNFAPVVLFIVGMWLFIATNKIGYALLGLALCLSLMFLTPVLPKGEVERSPVINFEPQEAPLNDSLRKPDKDAKERGEHINNRLDAVEQAKQ